MNTAYNYKTGKNNASYNRYNSKKETCKSVTHREPALIDFTDKCLSFIDMVIDILSSARVLVIAKALFAFIALLGFIGIIGGMELGTVSLFSGVICLSLVIALEFFILKD